MPIDQFQMDVFRLLRDSRNPDSYVAGGTAIHRREDSLRYSHDIDFFHDTDEAVATSFSEDTRKLTEKGYDLQIVISQPSFYRALIKKGGSSLSLDWARDTSFRFFPVVEDDLLGFRLHDADLAVNKCLALAGRTELRDALDMIELHILAACM